MSARRLSPKEADLRRLIRAAEKIAPGQWSIEMDADGRVRLFANQPPRVLGSAAGMVDNGKAWRL